ncbi:hypothetical protein NA56DRAFT_751274 [Hyaloscypha hepaticicola]|uniref:Uncharacterized protein n=1 Tax=Hyaloscypha hepaticicola TaxID=2082293 RepID=A0A2J6PX48_9HELO|nr:hypothetical protein NA56DRAFT_751274 [Hyaloscypha hepaticicola]
MTKRHQSFLNSSLNTAALTTTSNVATSTALEHRSRRTKHYCEIEGARDRAIIPWLLQKTRSETEVREKSNYSNAHRNTYYVKSAIMCFCYLSLYECGHKHLGRIYCLRRNGFLCDDATIVVEELYWECEECIEYDRYLREQYNLRY